MTRTLLLVSLVLCALGCRSSSAEGPPDLFKNGVQDEEEPWYGLGFSPESELVVFDPATGIVLGRTAGGGGAPRDVVVDASGSVWVLEENEDASGSEILRCALVGTNPGPCEHAAWVDGIGALWASGAGLWVFEDGAAGPRWKVLRDGAIAEGVFAPRPASLWEEGDHVEALTYGASGDALERWGAAPSAGSLVAERRPVSLGKPMNFPPTTRFVPTSAAEGFLWDVVDGSAAARRVFAGGLGPWEKPGGPLVTRIEAAAALKLDGGAEGAFLVVSTESVLVFGDGAAGLGAAPVYEVPLAGLARREISFFSRDLAVLGARALVATDRGVRAIVVERGARAFRDERFDGDALRGPLAVFRHRFDTK